MPLFPTVLPTESLQYIEQSTRNLKSTTKTLEKTAQSLEKLIEMALLSKLGLEYDKGVKIINVLIGSTLSTRSMTDIMYAKSLTSKIFFFLSCVSGSAGAITSATSSKYCSHIGNF